MLHPQRLHAEFERRAGAVLEFASVELSLRNLMSFPWVRLLVEQGHLQLHGAYFGVASGRLLVRDPASGRFEPVAGEAGQLPPSAK
jgi:carbonic anhydrase